MSRIETAYTPAHGQPTLFVTGVPDLQRVLAESLDKGTTHVHLGVDGSYDPDGTADYWKPWDDVILDLLKANVWVTLEFAERHVQYILESGYTEYDTFIAMVVVDTPYIQQLGYNATLKLHDSNAHSAWYHSIHELRDRKKFVHSSKVVDFEQQIEYNTSNED